MSTFRHKLLIFIMILGVLLGTFAHQPTASTQAQDNPEFGSEWFGDGVLYEVFVRSFRDSDGDGIGDLRGVIDGLDYIQSLGANIIWLMPIHPSTTYHGYDVTDYYGINPDYGTMDDMQALITAVHERDMYIIIDYVANHSSNENPLFMDAFGNPDSEYTNFYRWTNDAHTEYRTFYGEQHMPEINYGYPPARQYMVDVATYWLDPNGDGDTSDGVDGLRCDVATGPPISFWREVRSAMLEVNPDSLLLAEAWLRSGTELQPFLVGDAFNAIFDFPTLHALIGDNNRNGDGNVSGGSMQFAEGTLKGSTLLFPEGSHLVRFISNHDTNRFMSEVEGDWDRAKAGAVWLYTVSGTPMIYYGEEIGMFGTKGDSGYYDEYRREPLDWYTRSRGEGMTTWFRYGDRNNISRDGISVEEQTDDPDSLLTLYQDLGAFRQATSVLREGTIDTLGFTASGANLYGIVRGDLAGDFVLVIINFTDETVESTLVHDELPFDDFNSLNVEFGDAYATDGLNITIEPAGYVILTN